MLDQLRIAPLLKAARDPLSQLEGPVDVTQQQGARI